MEFRILGPLEVLRQGHAVPLGGTKQRAVLAILLLNANEVVSSDRLTDALWGDQRPETASAGLQNFVSQLRKLLEPESAGRRGHRILLTRSPGYLLRVDPEQLDLERFERLLSEAREEPAEPRAAKLREALALWRGDPLADLAHEPFAQAEIQRLEELRLVAIEERIDADLARGRHADLVGELDTLIAKHPLRDRLRGQLMLALYRSGRQREALQAYQDARRALIEELGIEPGTALKALERQILAQDPALDLPLPVARQRASEAPPERAILVISRDDADLDRLLALAEPLARSPQPHALIVARLVEGDGRSLSTATALLRERRAALAARQVTARAAAFTSSSYGADAARLASEQDVDLLLSAESMRHWGERGVPGDVGAVLEGAPCDVAVVASESPQLRTLGDRQPVAVPFGGGEHDWAALEIGAWIASAHGAPLKLLGAAEDRELGSRDASRLLASASLAVQQVVGVVPEPFLTPPGPEGVLAAAGTAGLLVLGISSRWRHEGLGAARTAIIESATAPTLVVRRGPRPGGLAPRGTFTRFTWSLVR
jgi:DNA-binding SARP family transcriptional activator